MNEEHLVYTAVDADGKDILEFSVINGEGNLAKQDAIVADRTIWWDTLHVYEGLTS